MDIETVTFTDGIDQDLGAQAKLDRTMPEMIYILSPSYSGSTLLTCLLARHPDIATVGELKASALGSLDSYKCSCGELLRECQFWDRIASRMTESRRGCASYLRAAPNGK